MDTEKNTSNNKEDTSNNTKNYVSGDRIPSSIDHRFTRFDQNNDENNISNHTQNENTLNVNDQQK